MQTKFNVQFINGIRGASAYEVALRNGFRGTEQEWLQSLKAVQVQADWLQTDANASDYIKNKPELLKGDKGDKGDTGEQGIQGEKGADGYTPVKGTDYFTEADKAEIINEISASGGTSGGEYTVLVDEAITSDEGIAKIQYTDIDFHKYEDIVIYFDKPVNVSANTSDTRFINVYMLGYPIVHHYNVAGPDGYRSVLLRILNMKNDNVVCFSSVSNNQMNNPTALQCCGIYPLNQNYMAGYDIGFKLEFNIAYVGTCNLKILAK